VKRHHLVVLAVAFAGASLTAQQTDRAKALDDQITQIFSTPTYAAPFVRRDGARWIVVPRSSDPPTRRARAIINDTATHAQRVIR
jgi:hypothetical protein